VELVLMNSHDADSAYQLHAGVFRRLCANGLVVSEGGFTALRFRHAGLTATIVVEASLRLLAEMPRLGGLIERSGGERWTTRCRRDCSPKRLCCFGIPASARRRYRRRRSFQVRRQKDDGRGRLRSVRALRGIDSKLDLNNGLWSLAKRMEKGETLSQDRTVTVSA